MAIMIIFYYDMRAWNATISIEIPWLNSSKWYWNTANKWYEKTLGVLQYHIDWCT